MLVLRHYCNMSKVNSSQAPISASKIFRRSAAQIVNAY